MSNIIPYVKIPFGLGSSSEGGGGGSTSGVFVGLLDNSTIEFPTERLDHSSLQDNDYCQASSDMSVQFPLIVQYTKDDQTHSIQVDYNGQKVIYQNGDWNIADAGYSTTNEVIVSNSTQESISGISTKQNQINSEVKTKILGLATEEMELSNKTINCLNNNHISNLEPASSIKTTHFARTLSEVYYYCWLEDKVIPEGETDDRRRVYTLSLKDGNVDGYTGTLDQEGKWVVMDQITSSVFRINTTSNIKHLTETATGDIQTTFNRDIMNDTTFMRLGHAKVPSVDLVNEFINKTYTKEQTNELLNNIGAGGIQYVSSFEGITGDEHKLYYLIADYSTYKKGFYRFLNNQFILIGGDSTMFIDVQTLPRPQDALPNVFYRLSGNVVALYLAVDGVWYEIYTTDGGQIVRTERSQRLTNKVINCEQNQLTNILPARNVKEGFFITNSIKYYAWNNTELEPQRIIYTKTLETGEVTCYEKTTNQQTQEINFVELVGQYSIILNSQTQEIELQRITDDESPVTIIYKRKLYQDTNFENRANEKLVGANVIIDNINDIYTKEQVDKLIQSGQFTLFLDVITLPTADIKTNAIYRVAPSTHYYSNQTEIKSVQFYKITDDGIRDHVSIQEDGIHISDTIQLWEHVNENLINNLLTSYWIEETNNQSEMTFFVAYDLNNQFVSNRKEAYKVVEIPEKLYYYNNNEWKQIGGGSSVNIVTELTAQSTNDEVPGAKATFDHVNTSLEQVVVALQQRINNLKKYIHRITLGNPSTGDKYCFDIITSQSTPYTSLQQIGVVLNQLGYTLENNGIQLSYCYMATGEYGYFYNKNIAIIPDTSAAMVTFKVYEIAPDEMEWHISSSVYQTFLSDTLITI